MKALFLSVIFTLFSSVLYANSTWTLTGDLNHPRSYHTATSINSNQVLVAGGDMNTVLLNSAEILNITTGIWSSTNSMNQKRQKHVAIQLDDGRVLVAGGSGISADLASVEIYDPTSSTWSTVTSMSSPRVSALITKLQDGRILVSSGTANGVLLNTAEIYNPTSNSWTSTGSMASDAIHTNSAVLLQDGRVFVKGHAGYKNSPFVDPITPWPAESETKLPQIYSPATNSWTAVNPMITPKRGGTSIVLNNGNVLVVGGDKFAGDSWGYPFFACNFPSEIYNPDTDTWTETGALTVSTSNPSKLTLLPDGKVLAFGSAILFDPYSGCASDRGLTEIFDPTTGTWASTDTAATRHHNGGAFASFDDGKALSIGGGDIENIAEVYTPSGPSPTSPSRSETMHVGDIDGQSIENTDGSWTAIATVTIVDENNQGVYHAVVTINSTDCVTDYLGQCSSQSTNTTNNDRYFNVNNVAKLTKSTVSELPPITYIASANTDPDGDSDGNTIIIQREGATPPPSSSIMHVSDLEGFGKKEGKRRWRANVDITVSNDSGNPISNAKVSGSWGGSGVSGSGTCTTDSSGVCRVSSDRIKNKYSSVTFSISDITHSTLNFDSALNTDADGDSDGTTYRVNKP